MTVQIHTTSADLKIFAEQATAASDLTSVPRQSNFISPRDQHSQQSSQTQDYSSMAESGCTTPPSVVARETSTSLFPDLIDQQFQDEHTSAWPQDQYDLAAYQALQQIPTESIADSEEPQIQAFAKLEFEDGEFYMNTYAVIVGRDIEAAREASEKASGSASKAGRRSASKVGSVRSEKSGKEGGWSIPGSVASDGEKASTDLHHHSQNGKKTKKKKSKSWSSSSRPLSRTDSTQFAARRMGAPKTDYNALAMASLMEYSTDPNGIAVDISLPSPNLVPMIPIHPPTMADGDAPGHKSISRRHIKIVFNFEQHLFQVEIMGRNGVFIDDHWHPTKDVVPLVNGSMIQIGGVSMRFVLPEVPPGETGADMSLDMGDDPLSAERVGLDMADSDDDESEDEEEDEDKSSSTSKIKEEEGEEPELSRTRRKGKKSVDVPVPVPTKRKGPGRPPKNGIISKREQALLARQAKEEAKAKAEGKTVAVKGKVSKEAKESKESKKETNSIQPNGKRKYVKRKRAGGTEDPQTVRESTEHTESVLLEQAALPPKPAKEKKPAKPPRSPSPVYDESKMTPEQLAKPQSSYVVLIHDALSNSKTGQMSLPQIYRAIERAYPYYKLRVQTQGWQSSVRHNLSQHPAFRKIERDGKGWMWGLVPEVSIEKEKKRRTTPPTQVSQQHYYAPNPMMQHPYPYPAMHPPNGPMASRPYGMHPGVQPGRIPYPPPPRAGFPLPLINAQSESNYRSPYQSTPPPAAAQTNPQNQVAPQANMNNGNYPAPVSQPASLQPSTNYHDSKGPAANISASPHTQASPTVSGPSAAPSQKIKDAFNQQDVKEAVTKFKTALLENMADGEAMVTSAINRVLGIQDSSSLSGGEDPNEKTIMNKFSAMLEDLSKQKKESNRSTIPSNAAPSSKNGVQSSEAPTPTAIAATNAAKVALADSGDSTTVAQGASEVKGIKRPSEGDEDEPGPANQPEPKRIAS